MGSGRQLQRLVLTGLAQKGEKLLLVDQDAQSNLTMNLGYPDPDEIEVTMFKILESVISKKVLPKREDYILSVEGGYCAF